PPTAEPTMTDAFVSETPTVTATPTAQDQLVSDTGGIAVAQGATEIPFDDAGGQEDVFALTATQIVAEVTQTADASITLTAQALFGALSPTPFPSPTFADVPGLATATPGVAAPPGTVCIHEVVQGETLFRLSLRYGVSVNQLAAASGITNIQLILVGQKVNIPGCGTTGVFPPPTSVPTVAAAQFGTGGAVTGDGTTAAAQAGGTGFQRVHVVEQYETLFQISLTYGVSVASIANANGITDINNILMGTELIIPGQ
ncbi:MAG: LysM peptidoglycan-binding domain-containing protein, partial [Anaerolineae bacterium]|nr:LysM peptidoglycan-binding domain-containing protein [Anaerolineae bacterium]